MKILIGVLLISAAAFTQPKAKWEGTIPALANKPERWHSLIDDLYKEGHYFGVLAASFRMIHFFDDLKSKEKAFQYLVALIDIGYPHSLMDIFFVGDLDQTDRNKFIQSYNFYKGVTNKIKKMEKWSADFFERIDKENFKKYLFYQAIKKYNEKDLIGSLDILDKILRSELSPNDYTFAKKVVRTKARIHFERKEYEKSLSYYDEFLLKVNPLTPSDWLEKSWNLYYLKKYDELMGSLYNLESNSAQGYPSFEKYILRAQVYLENCRVQNISLLTQSFNKEFKQSVEGIIRGKRLSRLKQLQVVARTTHPQYKKVLDSVINLNNERKKIGDLKSRNRELARYLYQTELKILKVYTKFYKEEALDKAAEELTMLSESLKFLGYSTAREKYNPLTVFIPREKEQESLVDVIDYHNKGFVFKWKQLGDYWRDEREKYYGAMSSKCD